MIKDIKVQVRGGYLRAIPSEDPDYPGIWVDFIRDTEKEDIVSRPQVLVEQPEYFKDRQARVLIWRDPDSEDYTDEIILK